MTYLDRLKSLNQDILNLEKKDEIKLLWSVAEIYKNDILKDLDNLEKLKNMTLLEVRNEF
jgi:hypothetical protein